MNKLRGFIEDLTLSIFDFFKETLLRAITIALIVAELGWFIGSIALFVHGLTGGQILLSVVGFFMFCSWWAFMDI